MLKIIVAPLLGGIIGYITNELAIRMLFRPRKEIYIGKWHVPFTPGLIPKQKGRVAASIGRVISSQLLNAETIRQTVLSEAVLEKLRGKLTEFFGKFQQDTRTVEDVLGDYVDEEKRQEVKLALQEKGTDFLMDRLTKADIGKQIVDHGIALVKAKLQNHMLGMFVDDSMLAAVGESILPVVNDAIQEKAPELFQTEIGKLEEGVLGTRLCDIYASQESRLPRLTEQLTELYRTTVDNHLEKLLSVVNIENIVVEKVNSFDEVQLEQMIFGIMKKELRAIVYLGALLGFLMGFLNLLF